MVNTLTPILQKDSVNSALIMQFSRLHFISVCSLYDERRQTFSNGLKDFLPDFVNLNNKDQFIFLLSTNDVEILDLLIHFINDCFNLRKTMQSTKI